MKNWSKLEGEIQDVIERYANTVVIGPPARKNQHGEEYTCYVGYLREKYADKEHFSKMVHSYISELVSNYVDTKKPVWLYWRIPPHLEQEGNLVKLRFRLVFSNKEPLT